MNKSSLSRALFAAGALALAGAAQAGSMTGSGETSMTPTTTMGAGYDGSVHGHRQLNSATGSGETSMSSTATMGAGPATPSSEGTTTYYTYPENHQFIRGGDRATSTFNVPGRAGEASTMTNGVPNVSTSNAGVQSSGVVVVPYTSTND